MRKGVLEVKTNKVKLFDKVVDAMLEIGYVQTGGMTDCSSGSPVITAEFSKREKTNS